MLGDLRALNADEEDLTSVDLPREGEPGFSPG